MTSPVDLLTQVARSHHGLFRFEDASAAGLSVSGLRHLLDRGWCDHPAHGVYRICGAPDGPTQELLVVVWSKGPDAVASHRAAARLWRLPGFERAAPEVTRPHGQNQRQPVGRLHCHVSLRLPAAHQTVKKSVPVTTPARTVFDVAGIVHPGLAERTLDTALQRRLCTIGQVHQVFFALARRGRRGTATMRDLLEDRGAGYVPPASELERLARKMFVAAGLPDPAFEVDLGDEAWIGRVDCVWRAERVVVELDGRRYHDGLSSRRRDRERDNRLMASGWRVIRVTWDDLVERPDTVTGWVRRALAAAA